jgi:hypothetical protein
MTKEEAEAILAELNAVCVRHRITIGYAGDAVFVIPDCEDGGFGTEVTLTPEGDWEIS